MQCAGRPEEAGRSDGLDDFRQQLYPAPFFRKQTQDTSPIQRIQRHQIICSQEKGTYGEFRKGLYEQHRKQTCSRSGEHAEDILICAQVLPLYDCSGRSHDNSSKSSAKDAHRSDMAQLVANSGPQPTYKDPERNCHQKKSPNRINERINTDLPFHRETPSDKNR